MARLIVTLNNQVLGKQLVAAGSPVTIGRHPDNRIVIDNLAVSAHHAKIFFNGQQLTVTDLGSRNGTRVNNEIVTQCPLAHQDCVTIGKHTIIVDFFESLPLETTVDQLFAHAAAASEADQTLMLDRQEVQPGWLNFDYLSFLTGRKEDYELTGQTITIGKNADADIRITGVRSLFAGSPSATIRKDRDEYLLTCAGGWFRPRVNGMPVKEVHRLRHQDIVRIGPIRFQILFVRRPLR